MGRNFADRILFNELGSTAIEYALIAALIFAVIAGGLTALGGGVQASYDGTASKVEAALKVK